MNQAPSKPNFIISVLKTQCPHCRRANMFKVNNPYNLKKTLSMYSQCPNCKGDLEKEVGFYYGTGYVSYGLTIAVLVTWFIAYWLIFGISITDNSLFYYLGSGIAIVVLLQPYMMRLSRTIWLSLFEKYKFNK